MGGRGFGLHLRVAFPLIGTALRMAENHISAANVLQHRRADFAGMGALRCMMAISAHPARPSALPARIVGDRDQHTVAGAAKQQVATGLCLAARATIVARQGQAIPAFSPFIFQLPATSFSIPRL